MKLKIIAVILTFFLLSCDFFIDDKEGLTFDEKSFEENKSLWVQNDISNYSFNQKYFDSSRGPMPEIGIKVSNNEFKSKDFVSGDDGIHENDLYYFKTINEIFIFVERVVAECKDDIESNHESSMLGAEIRIEYDETYHFPRKVDCSGYYEEGVMGGLSSHLQITYFEEKQ